MIPSNLAMINSLALEIFKLVNADLSLIALLFNN